MDKSLIWLLLGTASVVIFLGRKTRTPEENRQLYKPTFASASNQTGVPADLLERVAQQESSFRSEIISGAIKSAAGAVGIMQIIPRWHPDVNPFDPVESIYYAAHYLATLYSKYGNWTQALQAYNWGPGNLDNYLAGNISAMPEETQNYSDSITTDLGIV